MLHRAALLLVMMMMILGMRVEAAPTDRGFVKPQDPFPRLTQPPAVPHKYLLLNPSQSMKRWLRSTKAATPDGTTKTTDKTITRTMMEGVRASRSRSRSDTSSPDKREKMLKIISALEDLHRALNSTLSSRITIMPRANGRNSGRKNKVKLPDGAVKSTTAAPFATDGTSSQASADVVVPSLTGRNFRKSLPPQNKKTNKRVCFWKYCSQN